MINFTILRNFLGRTLLSALVIVMALSSCKSYKDHLMFTYEDDYNFSELEQSVRLAESSYTFKPFDRVSLEVYTNQGERIIDPDFELNRETPGGQSSKPEIRYQINDAGIVDLPLIGEYEIRGQTILEANSGLAERYGQFYNDPYVLTSFANKRVIVLGAPGGKVIPLTEENMSVAEVIALAGGLEDAGRADNIRLIRGEDVFRIDMNTVDGYFNSRMNVLPDDIIYIEPIYRFSETFRDVTPIISVLTSFLTLVIVLINTN